MKKLLPILALLFAANAFAQVPSITSFTPTSGSIGTAVTITGTNFNTTAANNIVYFGGALATVNSATATTLNVTVPIGASYAPITVLNITTVLMTASARPFDVTFACGDISATSMAPKVDFTTGTAPYDVAFGDLDGDGKADMVVTNNQSAFISVYRNTSTSGTITSGSFATNVDFTVANAPTLVSLGDVDGDGKLDIVVTGHFSNSISVLRNVSTSGTITTSSFEPKVDFSTAADPYGIAIGDLDVDGKPDMVAVNNISYVASVLRNTSTGGTLTGSSFATAVNFIAGNHSYFVALGDIDGDGKLDMAVSNSQANTVSVFRNTSTSGTITSGSFAAAVDFTTGTNPYGVSLGDIDGDGKLDMAVTNNNSTGGVSVFRNTATSGTITTSSFAVKVDFASGINPECIALGDADGDGKVDMAVTNNGSNTVSVFKNTATSGTITTSSFANKVDFTTGTNPHGISLCDIDGDEKLDMALTNSVSNTVSVFRNIGIVNSPAVTISGNTTFCAGGSITLTSQGTGTYLWSPNGETTQAISVTQSGSYSVTVTNNTCQVTSLPVVVTVNQLPTATITPQSTTTFCSGGSVTLTSQGTGTYLWSPNGETTQAISATQSGNYTVIVTSAQGCAATSQSVSVTVNQNPVVTLSPFSALCSNAQEVTLTGGSPANGSYTLDGNAATSIQPWLLSAGSHPVVYSYTDGNGCSGSASQNVIINAAPTVTLSGLGTSYIVTDAPVQLSGTPAGGIFTGAGVQGNMFDPSVAGVGTHSIIYMYSSGCMNADGLCTTVELQVGNGGDDMFGNGGNFSVIPNPNSGSFSINLNSVNPLGLVTLEIYSSLGQLIQSEVINNQSNTLKKQIDLNLAKGIYHITLQTNEGRSTKKIEIIK